MLEIIEKIPETGSFSRSTDAMNAIRVMKGHKNVVIMLSKVVSATIQKKGTVKTVTVPSLRQEASSFSVLPGNRSKIKDRKQASADYRLTGMLFAIIPYQIFFPPRAISASSQLISQALALAMICASLVLNQ